MEHGTGRIRILRAAGHPVRAWGARQARDLLMGLGDAGRRVKFVLHDGGAGRTAASGEVFGAAGAGMIRAARRRGWIRSWNGGPAAAAAGCRAGPWCGISGTW
jgi:hypothetical protein